MRPHVSRVNLLGSPKQRAPGLRTQAPSSAALHRLQSGTKPDAGIPQRASHEVSSGPFQDTESVAIHGASRGQRLRYIPGRCGRTQTTFVAPAGVFLGSTYERVLLIRRARGVSPGKRQLPESARAHRGTTRGRSGPRRTWCARGLKAAGSHQVLEKPNAVRRGVPRHQTQRLSRGAPADLA